MQRVYVCSRLRSDEDHSLEFHQAVAETMCRNILMNSNGKKFPIAPHLYMPHFLDDDKPDEREMACDIGIELLKQCHEMKVVVVDGIISKGMLAEIYAAQQMSISIDYFYCTKAEMREIIAANKE